MEKRIFIILILLALPLTLLQGFVISTLWRWFCVPVFHVSILTMAQAIGLGVLISYASNIPSKKNETKNSIEAIIESVCEKVMFAVFALLIGYITTLFM